MFQQFIRVAILVVGALLVAPALGQEPTIDQVYKEAQSGNLAQAQSMMAGVLRAHPNSAKAHFVSAELLARQGKLADADAELRTAERLEPGLPFATPQAVQELHRRVASAQGTVSRASPTSTAPYGGGIVSGSTGGGIPWLTLLLVAGVALVVYVVLRSRRGNATSVPVAGGGGAYNGARPMPGPGYAPQAPTGGMGSGILGGLATGAALGAGMVAGEALAHRWADGRHDSGSASPAIADSTSSSDSMGGNDFGVADASSWDDNLGGGGGGGSDWT